MFFYDFREGMKGCVRETATKTGQDNHKLRRHSDMSGLFILALGRGVHLIKG